MQVNDIHPVNALSRTAVRLSPNYPKSPLRYPGGKSRAVDTLSSLIPRGTRTLVSPFFGGGSLELAVAHRGIRVYGYDLFEPLVDFWSELLLTPRRLAAEVQKLYPLSREAFYQLKEQTPASRLKKAVHFYVINRCSFSGSTFSGGMSPNHPRFTLSSINYIRSFHCPNIIIKQLDFRESLRRHSKSLLYLDPPYLIPGGLYGKNGSTHKNFDHQGLCEQLRRRGRWILSYNDCQEIRRMYTGYRLQVPHWKYGMSNDKNSRELIILSNDL